MTNLDKIIKNISNNHVFIQTHNFPDPDAISSAFGLKRLLERRGKKATICYYGAVERSGLAKMVEELRIEMVNITEKKTPCYPDEVILIDAQKGNANMVDISGKRIFCIDHHPIFEKYAYSFSDIRPNIGACASIIASYYKENKIRMEQDVATALLFGIKIDTANLSRGVSKVDLDMFYRIYPIADQELIGQFEKSTLEFEDLHAYANAIDSIHIYDHVSFANTGENCPEALIANISDFTLGLSEVEFSVVYSIRQDGIKLSIRSKRSSLDAGKVSNRALNGIGNGGGHASMAGGFVPFTSYVRSVPLLIAEIEERFLHTLGGNTLEFV